MFDKVLVANRGTPSSVPITELTCYRHRGDRRANHAYSKENGDPSLLLT